MSKIVIGQSYQLSIETGVALATAETLEIRYRKPDGSTGAWTATVHESTQARYTVTAADNDTSGHWRMQAYAAFPGGVTYLGDVVEQYVRRVYE